jgi:hypothetical protein
VQIIEKHGKYRIYMIFFLAKNKASNCTLFTIKIKLACGPGSSVGIAIDYWLDGPGSNPGGDEIFRPSRPAQGPIHPPVQLGTGSFLGVKCGQGVLLTTHPLLVRRSWKSRAIRLPTLWATPGL